MAIMICDFISMLSMLRKSSAESVENTDKFDAFKSYLHVERQVEVELRELLRTINEQQKKCLVLLCGSAGDGKSHLISYLINSDDENLLLDYEPYNDATESALPKLTSIETLGLKLKAFDDDHLDDDKPAKMIVAINLGTLNNFIESEVGKKYTRLKQYVDNMGILSGYTGPVGFCEGSIFQHISFADYQVFSLNENGVETAFLEELLKKVFAKCDENPFYGAYLAGCSCPNSNRCPVRHNFEFLSNEMQQRELIKRIVKAVIVNKTIVSTRDVLNLIYDLLVHPDFKQERISIGTSDIQYLNDYILMTTPMLIDEFGDISNLVDSIRTQDVLKTRDAVLDSDATRFHSLDNIDKIFSEITDNTAYAVLKNITNVSELGAKKPELKKNIYKFLIRLRELVDYEKRYESKQQKRIVEYVKYLYCQNAGKTKKLANLYEATENAVLKWDGDFGPDYICVDDTNDRFWILENLNLTPSIDTPKCEIDGAIQRFEPVIKIEFSGKSGSSAGITIDYFLFNLIADMRAGYRPTTQDKNHHAEFISFVQQIISFGDKEKKITMIPKEPEGYSASFEIDVFGNYKFRVVK